MVKITEVVRGSLAARAGIRAGDVLVSVNRKEIDDVLDYRFRMTSRRAVLRLTRGGRKLLPRIIIKPEEETDIGLGFETPLMDGKHTCRNRCIFCFIDQNPPGMRESCYFKDDDSRLSFLHGNYITMTNLSEHEIDRIIEMHISPVNISVHTTNPELRCKLMHNRFAGDSLAYLRRFADAGIRICAQIVLCRGINDGPELDRTMRDLTEYLPALDSVSVVPAGLTKYREGLYPLSPYSPEECAGVIAQVVSFGDACLAEHGSRVFYAADEFYVKAGLPLPGEDFYGDFSQLDDGVGMLTLFEADAKRRLDAVTMPEGFSRRVSVATGYAAYDELCAVCRMAEEKIPGLSVSVLKIRNDFFGESVTVSGLLTGGDIAAQAEEARASGTDLGEMLLIPRTSLRADGDLFLDNMTPSELATRLCIDIATGGDGGDSFIDALCGIFPGGDGDIFSPDDEHKG
ncbi:MAG: DUF512 domain-containing protein [Clostridia bacterium]|nr:DUF512 domain-containing protein [Clostridia bacterium]